VPPVSAEDQALIELAIACHRFRALPRAGGILDQDAATLERMLAIMHAGWWREVMG